jgi:hypothetical protein
LLGAPAVKLFNSFYFRHKGRKTRRPHLVPWDAFFFPLDGVGNWNRMYGSRGFVQHQCVVPHAAGASVLGAILDRMSSLSSASFLAVLKSFGPRGRGLMSFPMPGFTLAVDIPVQPGLFDVLKAIDREVVAAGGRIYLAKDACQSRETVAAGYPGLPAFRAFREAHGLHVLQSHLSQRLAL